MWTTLVGGFNKNEIILAASEEEDNKGILEELASKIEARRREHLSSKSTARCLTANGIREHVCLFQVKFIPKALHSHPLSCITN